MAEPNFDGIIGGMNPRALDIQTLDAVALAAVGEDSLQARVESAAAHSIDESTEPLPDRAVNLMDELGHAYIRIGQMMIKGAAEDRRKNADKQAALESSKEAQSEE